MADREHRRRIGSELLASILEGRMDGSAAAAQLELHGLRPDALVLAALERSALFVHKQTLVYRMKRVEELTGR